jgi:three-Cys-motif partner protein
MPDFRLYQGGREATWIKHYVLREYLERLAYKVGSWCNTLNYVDGFAGPWRAADESLSDTSPHIAISELTKASQGLKQRGNSPAIRCLFVERDHEAVSKLRESLKGINSVSTTILEGEFESFVDYVLQFARSGQKNFTFFFIDPTGWTGYGMKVITPILQHTPGEVLINFMTKDIKRFIDDPLSSALTTFQDLFGSGDFRKQWSGLTGIDREDAIVKAYCERVRSAGKFAYVVSTVVLHPTDSRTHFHLIYGTRRIEGLRVFREVEAKTVAEQERIRAAAQQAQRVYRSMQYELFPSDIIGAGTHYQTLRTRYVDQSRSVIQAALTQRKTIPFDELEEMALTQCMTSTQDLKGWLREWQARGLVAFQGLGPRGRIPQPGKNHYVEWLG